MANVLFKRGLQNQLPTSGIIDGAFYLTTDTNRLYVGNGSELALLNQSINIIATQNDLPKNGGAGLNDFYFIKEGNVLAYYNGSQWVQINPDNNTELEQSSAAVTTTVAENAATIGVEVKDTAGHSATGSVKISSGSENVTIDKTDKGFSIAVAAPETVDFSIEAKDSSTDNEVNINLLKQIGTQTSSIDSSVILKGNDFVSVNYGSDNKIEIAGADQTINSASLGFGNDGKLSLVINHNGSQKGNSITPIVKVGSKDEEFKFVNGTADLPVYTIDDINELLGDYETKVNAMSYRGSVAKESDLPSSAELGDVYMLASQDGTHKAGDLFIYNGTGWDHIPAGHDTDTTYSVVATGNGSNSFVLNSSTGGAATGSIAVKAAEGGVLTAAGTVTDGKNLTVTLSHNTVTDNSPAKGSATQTAKNELSFDVVESVTRDSYGHVSSVATKAIKVVDTHNALESVVVEAGTDGTVATTVKMTDGEQKSDNVKFASSSLEIKGSNTNNNAQIDINLVWGSF